MQFVQIVRFKSLIVNYKWNLYSYKFQPLLRTSNFKNSYLFAKFETHDMISIYCHYTLVWIIHKTNFYGKIVWMKKSKIFEKIIISHKNVNNTYFEDAILKFFFFVRKSVSKA